MAAPKSVKKQVEEAKRLQEALNQPPEEPTPEPEEKPNETKGLEGKPGEDPEAGQNPEKDPPKVAAEAPTDQETDWEKRFKGMKKLYDREVPKLRGDLEAAYAQVEELRKEIEAVKTEITKQPEPEIPEVVELTPEEKEQYGEGWIQIMSKIANQGSATLAKQVVDLQRQLAELKNEQANIKEVVQVTNARDFYTELARRVKDATGKNWEDINTDVEFHAFLAEEVPYTGKERQFFLLQAKDALDVVAASQFFIDFIESTSSSGKSAEPEPSVPEEIVEPETVSGGIPPIEEKKIYTTGEINQFYADKRMGKYKGKEKEAREIERDIIAAGQEGRIVDKRMVATA